MIQGTYLNTDITFKRISYVWETNLREFAHSYVL